VEVAMKRGDLVKNIKTGDLFIVRVVKTLSGRDWLFMEPVGDGHGGWTKSKFFVRISNVWV
jgi:hypothetical protein